MMDDRSRLLLRSLNSDLLVLARFWLLCNTVRGLKFGLEVFRIRFTLLCKYSDDCFEGEFV